MISQLDKCIIVTIVCVLNLSIVSVFGQDANNTKNIIDLNSIPAKQVKVDDIVISYKVIGNG